jgi:hypothetical protein
MAEIVVDYAAEEQVQARQCKVPAVFRATRGGYETWKAFAASTGRAAQWKAWSEDEPCEQRGSVEDGEAPRAGLGFCEAGAPE